MYISTENGIVSLANFSDSDLEPVRDRVSTIVKDGLDLVLTNNDKYLVVADLHGMYMLMNAQCNINWCALT